jgi:hypothetical protein
MNFDCKAVEIESLRLMGKRRFFGGMKMQVNVKFGSRSMRLHSV